MKREKTLQKYKLKLLLHPAVYFIQNSIGLNLPPPQHNCETVDVQAFQNACLAKISLLIRWVENNFEDLIKLRSDISVNVEIAIDLHVRFCAARNKVLDCQQYISGFKKSCLFHKESMLNLGMWSINIAYLFEAEIFTRHFVGQYCQWSNPTYYV